MTTIHVRYEILDDPSRPHPESVPDAAPWGVRETDPRRQITLLASIATRIGTRIAALTEVMAAAAGSDPEIATMYQQRQQARYADQRLLAQSLSRKGALRAGLSQAHAADIIWTLANPRTHRALVSERHWTTDEYERWLGHLLACALLAEPSM